MPDIGRGAWPSKGLGGTLDKTGSKPGPYYTLGVGKVGTLSDNNERAVQGAVKAIQVALNEQQHTKLLVDGNLGPKTHGVLIGWQNDELLAPDGLFGSVSAPELFTPTLRKSVKTYGAVGVTSKIISGITRTESAWDPGARGTIDPDDYGLGQINLPSHPGVSLEDALVPAFAFESMCGLLDDALDAFDGNIRDAIASYNLGQGGARSWIKAGRPDVWTPPGSSKPRNVKAYIDKILEG